MLPRVAHGLARATAPSRAGVSLVVPRLPVPGVGPACLAATRRVNTDAHKAAPTVATHSTSHHRRAPMKSVPIDFVSTTDDDSTYTLGQAARHKTNNDQPTFTHTSVQDVLQGKEKYGDALHSVKESASVASALQCMNFYSIGACLVTSDDDPHQIVGIFSTRDFIKRADHSDKPLDLVTMPVTEMMSHDPVFTYADTPALHSMNMVRRRMMNSGGFRHLPVRDRATDRTIGLISIGDLVRNMMRDYAAKSSFLQDYIQGRYPA